MKLFKIDLSNEKAITEKIKETYDVEYNELATELLLMDERSFMKQLSDNTKLWIIHEYSEVAIKNNFVIDVCKSFESAIQTKRYNKDLHMVSSAWNEYKANLEALESTSNRISKKNVDNLSYLESFIPHCRNTDHVAIHTCGSKLIEVRDSGKPNTLIFVICIGCKFVYSPSSIRLKCNSCDVIYYTKFLNEAEKNEDLVAATWESTIAII